MPNCYPENPKDLYHFTECSGNKKTGYMPVSMSNSGTCPNSCAFKGNGCYAESFPLSLHWSKLSSGALKSATDFRGLLYKIKALRKRITGWRHNQAGDLCGVDNILDAGRNLALAMANKSDGYNRGGFTYTHYPMGKGDNAEIVKTMNTMGFCVNLSADNLVMADKLSKLNVAPVVVVVPSSWKKDTKTPNGRKVKLCPATIEKDITCLDCLLCNKTNRSLIIGFPAHGPGKRKVDRIAKEYK